MVGLGSIHRLMRNLERASPQKPPHRHPRRPARPSQRLARIRLVRRAPPRRFPVPWAERWILLAMALFVLISAGYYFGWFARLI
jgi:hypothetical protein